jgi:hypothetical protein
MLLHATLGGAAPPGTTARSWHRTGSGLRCTRSCYRRREALAAAPAPCRSLSASPSVPSTEASAGGLRFGRTSAAPASRPETQGREEPKPRRSTPAPRGPLSDCCPVRGAAALHQSKRKIGLEVQFEGRERAQVRHPHGPSPGLPDERHHGTRGGWSAIIVRRGNGRMSRSLVAVK